MSPFARLLLFCALLAAGGSVCSAEEVEEAFDRILKVLANEGAERALADARETTAKWETSGHVEEAEELWVYLAVRLDQTQRFEAALPAYRETLLLRERIHEGRPHDAIAVVHNALGFILAQRLGRPEEGLVEFEAALAVWRAVHDGDHPAVATGINNVAFCLKNMGRMAEAMPRYEEALAMRERLAGDQVDPDVANSLVNIAECLSALGRQSEALARHQAALSMLQQIHGTDHPSLAVALNNVAGCLLELGRAPEALPLFQEAVDIWHRLSPPADPYMANTLAGMARCLTVLGRAEDAVPLAEEELAIRRRLGQTGARPTWTGVIDEDEFAALHELNPDDRPPLRGEMVRIGEARAYLSLPSGGEPKAAILVIHEWWGLNQHIQHWADRLAADGYAALAVDLYGGVVATTREEALSSMRAVNEEEALDTLLAAHRFLAEDERVATRKRACIGWCFGGGWSLRLAMAAPDLDAAVMYYGRVVTDPEQLSEIRAPMLGVFANQDRSIPPEVVDEFEAAMRSAGRQIEIRRYDAEHAFANPSSARYDAEHAALAWEEVRRFLREQLSGASATGQFALGERSATYTMPEEWKIGEPRSMRALNLVVGEATQCYIVLLPGAAGGIAANLRRWCREMGQSDLTDEQIAELPRFSIFGQDSPLLTVNGSYRSIGGEEVEEARLLGVICPLDQETLFVKMVGPKQEVERHEARFREFCESLRE